MPVNTAGLPPWMGGGSPPKIAYQGDPSVHVFLSYGRPKKVDVHTQEKSLVQDEALSDKIALFLERGITFSLNSGGDVNVFAVGADVFRAFPFKVWRDKESIKPSKDWREAIVDGMKQCEILLVIVPRQHSVRVALECGMAMGLQKTILPVAQDTSLLAEYGLEHLQLLEWDGITFDFDKLLLTLLDIAGKDYTDFTRYRVDE